MYTLTKRNANNRNFLAEDEEFNQVIVQTMFDLQIKLFSVPLQDYEEWVWDCGRKMYLSIVFHSL